MRGLIHDLYYDDVLVALLRVARRIVELRTQTLRQQYSQIEKVCCFFVSLMLCISECVFNFIISLLTFVYCAYLENRSLLRASVRLYVRVATTAPPDSSEPLGEVVAAAAKPHTTRSAAAKTRAIEAQLLLVELGRCRPDTTSLCFTS